jgi:hypothetical protein
MIKHLFEKVDYERQGFVHVNTFVVAALILKEDLAKLDVFASSTALRQMRGKCLEVCNKLTLCHHRMEVLLQEMCCLIYRDDYEEKISNKPINKRISNDFFRLSPEAKVALNRLADWRGEGPLPSLKSMGRMNTSHGTGKLRNAAAEGQFDENSMMLEGRSTQLRREVDFGDIIIIEQSSGPEEGQGKEDQQDRHHNTGDRRVVPLPVTAVISDTLVKVRIDRMVEIDKHRFEHFYIVRNSADEHRKPGAREDVTTLVQVPKAHYEPTVSQAVFEWDLTTKMKLRSKLEELEEQAIAETTNDDPASQTFTHGTKERLVELQQQENQTLLRHYASLQDKIVYLINRSMWFRAFRAWKGAVPKKVNAEDLVRLQSGLSTQRSQNTIATTATGMSVTEEGPGASAIPATAGASAIPGTTAASRREVPTMEAMELPSAPAEPAPPLFNLSSAQADDLKSATLSALRKASAATESGGPKAEPSAATESGQ